MNKVYGLLICLVCALSCSNGKTISAEWGVVGEHRVYWYDPDEQMVSDLGMFIRSSLYEEILPFLPENEQSVLERLNRSDAGELIWAGDQIHVLTDLFRYTKECYGAFDPTIQILWDVYEFDQTGRYVENEELESALQWVDYNLIEIEENAIMHRNENVRIGFGPTFPSLLVDSAVELLIEEGAERGAVVAEQNVGVIGEEHVYDFLYPLTRSTESGLQQTMGHVRLERGEFLSAIDNNVRTFLAHGEAFHMVLSPVDGRPVRSVRAALVVSGESCLQSAVFAYAVMVMGPDRGIEFLNETDGIEGVILTEDHEVIVSGGLGERFWR